MSEYILNHEAEIRLGLFFTIFLLMALWEIVRPRRPLLVSKMQRWVSNLGLVALNTLILRLLFPAAALGMASFTAQQGWGLFNYTELPLWLEVTAAVIILDMAIYLQHVMVHFLPLLWRLHRVHHADPDYDLTTGARFHPLEIILSMLIKFSLIAALGPAVVAVLIFEVILNGMAMFNHGNVSLPLKLDRVVRWLFVTPDMHRVHHSTEMDETNSNFGFNLSIWDRLFGTYRNQPRMGQDGMQIGLDDFPDPSRTTRLPGMLMIPFGSARK
jgi:sterol desaturase/sphingolipid hydroxylase (fatty acid hydroxylase superfamily)